jgi:hypothetical protein
MTDTIQDTFVLAWHQDGDRLVFAVEASLWPGHPDYKPPLLNEWTCYKPARLVFDQVRSVDGLPDPASAPKHTDTDGITDFGSLNELTAEPGGYRIAGDFGIVRVQAASVRLEIDRRN